MCFLFCSYNKIEQGLNASNNKYFSNLPISKVTTDHSNDYYRQSNSKIEQEKLLASSLAMLSSHFQLSCFFLPFHLPVKQQWQDLLSVIRSIIFGLFRYTILVLSFSFILVTAIDKRQFCTIACKDLLIMTFLVAQSEEFIKILCLPLLLLDSPHYEAANVKYLPNMVCSWERSSKRKSKSKGVLSFFQEDSFGERYRKNSDVISAESTRKIIRIRKVDVVARSSLDRSFHHSTLSNHHEAISCPRYPCRRRCFCLLRQPKWTSYIYTIECGPSAHHGWKLEGNE